MESLLGTLETGEGHLKENFSTNWKAAISFCLSILVPTYVYAKMDRKGGEGAGKKTSVTPEPKLCPFRAPSPLLSYTFLTTGSAKKKKGVKVSAFRAQNSCVSQAISFQSRNKSEFKKQLLTLHSLQRG